MYPEFASPRRLPGRKRSLQSELKCVAADVKSKLRPGTQRHQKPDCGAERGELTPQGCARFPPSTNHLCPWPSWYCPLELPESPFPPIA